MKYDWAVIGGGIAGISAAEILTRNGHKVALIEKDQKLAGQTTKDFHEWIHTGCLYTLLKDQSLTMKYMLGGIDDLLDYYSCFEKMNMVPTESGLKITKNGWFEPQYMNFKYKLRKFNPVWSLLTARSLYLVDKIAAHDWLRRRAGIIEEFKQDRFRSTLANLVKFSQSSGDFYSVKTSDPTTNSRILIRDMLATAVNNGLDLFLGQAVHNIRSENNTKIIEMENQTINANGVILCAGKNIAEFTDVKVKTSYAPMAVVNGLDDNCFSFVELDYSIKKCINLIVKDKGVGLIGGISLGKKNQCDEYLDYVIARHKQYQPNLKVLGRYIGLKNELTFPNQNRNYQFHIVNCDDNIWACIPGKFTLAFSMAPELYRRIYKKNPLKHIRTIVDTGQVTEYVSETRWQEFVNEASQDASRGPDKQPGNNMPGSEIPQNSGDMTDKAPQNLALSDTTE